MTYFLVCKEKNPVTLPALCILFFIRKLNMLLLKETFFYTRHIVNICKANIGCDHTLDFCGSSKFSLFKVRATRCHQGPIDLHFFCIEGCCMHILKNLKINQSALGTSFNTIHQKAPRILFRFSETPAIIFSYPR